jgi:ABC-type amino acid transport system permease subunit
MGWTDPLIGELRRHWKRAYPILPLTVYFLIIMVCLTLFSNIPLLVQILLASLTTTVAILVEYPQFKYVDDDFLMLVIPLMVLTGVYECLVFTGIA